MIDPAFAVAFAGKVSKSNLLQDVRDGVVDFLAERAKDIAGDDVKSKIESLRSDAKLNKQIQVALESAAKRWLEDSPDIDFVTAVAKDTSFHDLPSIKAAIRKVAQAPFHPIAVETLKGSFKDVLPARFDEERIEQGITEFLNFLREEFTSIPALQPTLQTFANLQTANYTASLPQIQDLLNQLLTGPTPTEETLQNYLRWVIDQHRYLDPKGAMQTVRQVQVLLEDVYVSLQAEEELPLGGVDRKLYEDEIKAIQEQEDLQNEERENFIENLQAEYLLHEEKGETKNQPVELTELTKTHEKLVILGDPGAGKTTLMRYLALRHAQAKRTGTTQTDELGKVFLPLYLRIAEYAENADGQSLTNFLPINICGKNHSDKSLPTLITEQLEQGNCLILLDGLDEVTESSQRSLISAQINSLIRAYEPKGNHIVITSRVAGYRLSPLDGDAKHYRVQDMNDEQIKRFLYQWCNAVERFQTPNLSPTAQQANAKKEIDGITSSINGNIGVKRLATNPLLLRTLALIHRTGARLPQRRIELYKLAADTLIKDWELARGIPEAALVNDDEATRLLSELAYWMHETKPAGLATEGEIKNKLAEVKAELAGKDSSDPDILKAVSEFLEKIRHHTGLFVERAPKRFGFMHLTFEEYFAARWLVNKPKLAAKRIRAKLHRPRWEEPILLAIAFYGMNFDDVSDLIEEAILGQDIGGPSPYEEVLHRDLFFAVRVMGDQDVKPALQNKLIAQFLELWFDEKDKGKFTPLRENWNELSSVIENSQAGQKLISALLAAFKDENAEVRENAIKAFSNTTLSAEAVPALVIALKDKNVKVRASAARAFRNSTLSADAVSALVIALKDEDAKVRASAARALSNSTLSADAVSPLLTALKDENTEVRANAASALRNATLSAEAVSALITALKDENAKVQVKALNALRNATQFPEVISFVLTALKDENAKVRDSATSVLRKATFSAETVSALITALKDEDAEVRDSAASVLRNATQFPEVVSALITALKDKNADVRDSAASALRNATQFPESISALITVFKDENAEVRESAASAFRNTILSADTVSALLTALKDENERVRASAASAFRNTTLSAEAISALLTALKDGNERVRANAASALRNTTLSAEVVSALITTLKDENAKVRASAVNALSNATQFSEAVSALITTLKDKNSKVRASAANALSNATQFPEVVSALITALKNENERVQVSAVSALRNVTQFPEVVSALITAFKDKNSKVRASAVKAFRNATLSAEAVSALITALKDEDAEVRDSAVGALSNATLSTGAVTALSATLKDEDAEVRAVAVSALRNAILSAEAVSTLITALNDEEAEVRAIAASALSSAASALNNAALSAEAISALIIALNDEEAEVRASAASALNELILKIRSNSQNLFAEQIFNCFSISKLDTSKKILLFKFGKIVQYNALDHLFEALSAVAGYPKIN